jgi:hypothetical protein
MSTRHRTFQRQPRCSTESPGSVTTSKEPCPRRPWLLDEPRGSPDYLSWQNGWTMRENTALGTYWKTEASEYRLMPRPRPPFCMLSSRRGCRICTRSFNDQSCSKSCHWRHMKTKATSDWCRWTLIASEGTSLLCCGRGSGSICARYPGMMTLANRKEEILGLLYS